MKYTSNSSKGCVLEVDLEYYKELHQQHNDYPLAPHKVNQRKDQRNQRKDVVQLSIKHFWSLQYSYS